MTYSTGNIITASDFNAFASSINAVWGVGTGDSGYGCSNTISSVTANVNTITSTQWTSLLARGSNAANHQKASPTWSGGTSVTVGNTISAITSISSDITDLGTNRLLTNPAGLTTSSGIITGSGSGVWNSSSVFTYTVGFADMDNARYFFNAGGKIQMSFSHSGGTGTKNSDWTSLCSACGTIVFAYNGTTKSGGSGSPNTLATSIGYYQLTTSNQTLFKQFSANAPYTTNYIQVAVSSDSITDTNSRGGKGSTLTFTVTFADAYSDTATTPAGTFSCPVDRVAPNTVYLNNVPTATFTSVSFVQT